VNRQATRFEDLDFLGPDRDTDQLEGLRVLVLGLGTHGGGTDLARFLHSKGALVSVSDHATRAALGASIDSIESIVDEDRLHLGGHQEHHLDGIDWVVVNPAIPPHTPFLKNILDSGVRPVTELGLFLAWAPHRFLAAVTGTNGKSTVCALAGEMLKASGIPVCIGGNWGGSLLRHLEEATDETRWIVEISSFQASRLGSEIPRPPLVALTTFAPDHLDWHGDEETYFRAKLNLLQPPHQLSPSVIVTADSPFTEVLSDLSVPPSLIPIPDQGESRGQEGATSSPALEGSSGRCNLAVATTLAKKLGATAEGCQIGAENFRGLPHRFEMVTSSNGVNFINDSKATTPDATLAALDRLDSPVRWLCGGKDKGIPIDDLVSFAATRKIHVFTYGDSADRIQEAFRNHSRDTPVEIWKTLEEAFAAAMGQCQPGDTVLLSPAFPSYDQYSSFEVRGDHFRTLVEGESFRDAED